MFRHPGKTTLLLAMAIMLSYSLGCILSPEEEIRPDPNPVEDYKDLTAPQNLIDNLVLCYKNKDAVKYDAITFSKVIEQDLGVMDATAVTLCRENNIPIIVFKLLETGNLRKIVLGEKVGTVVKGDTNG